MYQGGSQFCCAGWAGAGTAGGGVSLTGVGTAGGGDADGGSTAVLAGDEGPASDPAFGVPSAREECGDGAPVSRSEFGAGASSALREGRNTSGADGDGTSGGDAPIGSTFADVGAT